MLIGELCKRSGFSRDTIRYYEKLELISVERRHVNNTYKDYDAIALQRLLQVRRLKQTGFTLMEIRSLLSGKTNSKVCTNLPERIASKISDLDHQIATLSMTRATLSAVASACNGECAMQEGLPACIPFSNASLSLSKCG